ncbi:MAG TPA: GNAT family N-acetyltransferase [Pyrinomonadaceae bacterium]|nr:GNAT family N-acetyltransferase [Pyrinomonadaceae bacterium]
METESPVVLRTATFDDATSIVAVLVQSFIEYKAVYTAGGFAATTPDTEEVRRRMTEGPTWVAVQDSEIVGTVAVVPSGERLYIRSMAVIPSARGQNIGVKLLRHIEDFASANNYKHLFLSTTPFLSRAIKLYQQLGFVLSDQQIEDLHGTPLLRMEKEFD